MVLGQLPCGFFALFPLPETIYRSVYKWDFRGSLWSPVIGAALAAPSSSRVALIVTPLPYTHRVKSSMCICEYISYMHIGGVGGGQGTINHNEENC